MIRRRYYYLSRVAQECSKAFEEVVMSAIDTDRIPQSASSHDGVCVRRIIPDI